MGKICHFLLILFIFTFTPYMTFASDVNIKNESAGEIVYKNNRFDVSIEEAFSLFDSNNHEEAREKLDEYIELVFFPNDCRVMDLYNDIFLKLGKEDAVEQYKEYNKICQGGASREEILSFSESINDDTVYSDKNIFLWKSYLMAEYQGKLVESEEYSKGDNSMFVELVYAAKTRDKKPYKIPLDYEEEILASNHILKPSFIMLFIGNVRLFSKEFEMSNLINDMLLYEDVYLVGFQSHTSSYEYAFKYLGDREEDLEKRLNFRIDALKYALKYEEKGKDTFKQIIEGRNIDLGNTLFDIMRKGDISAIEDYISEIKEYSIINWEEFIGLYKFKEFDSKKINRLLGFYQSEDKYFSASNERSIDVLQKYFDKLLFPSVLECQNTKEAIVEKGLGDIISCSQVKSSDDQLNQEINSSVDEKKGNGNTAEQIESKNIFSFLPPLNKSVLLFISSLLTLLIIVSFIVYVFSKK